MSIPDAESEESRAKARVVTGRRRGEASWRSAYPPAFALILLVPILSGCRAKGAWTEADALREQIIEKDKQLAILTAERNEALAKLRESDRVRLTGSPDISAAVLESIPRCAGIELDWLSGVADRDRSDSFPFDTVEVSIKPFDSLHRFIQIAGTVNIRADYIPTESGADSTPRLLAASTFSPAQVREAYRYSFLTLCYSFRLPVENPPSAPGGSVALSVEFLDALSGQVHHASAMKQLVTIPK